MGSQIHLFAGLQRDYSKEFWLGAQDGFRGEPDVCRVNREQTGQRLKGSAEPDHASCFHAGPKPYKLNTSWTRFIKEYGGGGNVWQMLRCHIVLALPCLHSLCSRPLSPLPPVIQPLAALWAVSLSWIWIARNLGVKFISQNDFIRRQMDFVNFSSRRDRGDCCSGPLDKAEAQLIAHEWILNKFEKPFSALPENTSLLLHQPVFFGVFLWGLFKNPNH